MLDGIPIANLTAPALLGLTVLMIFLGWLVPRSVIKDKDKQIDTWRAAYETERRARMATDHQVTELLEFAKTDHAILVAAFGTTTQHTRQAGEAHVVSTTPPK